MLSQLLQILSRLFSPSTSTQISSEQSESSASSQAQSQGSSNSQSWITQATNQIRDDEGEVLYAYADHLGYWTIGVGRLIDKRKGGGISQDEATYLLTNDIKARVEQLSNVYPWFVDLDDARKGVMLNMSFQLGMGGLGSFKKTLSLIESGEYEAAADNMLKSKWAQQTPNRAQRLAEQMRSGQWQSG